MQRTYPTLHWGTTTHTVWGVAHNAPRVVVQPTCQAAFSPMVVRAAMVPQAVRQAHQPTPATFSPYKAATTVLSSAGFAQIDMTQDRSVSHSMYITHHTSAQHQLAQEMVDGQHKPPWHTQACRRLCLQHVHRVQHMPPLQCGAEQATTAGWHTCKLVLDVCIMAMHSTEMRKPGC